MINRYAIKEVDDIWSESNKFKNWLEIELDVCLALNNIGIIPTNDLEKIKATIGYNESRIYDLEQIYRHDVVAFTRAITEYMNNPTSRWIHYGLTSTDLVDTSNGINFYKSNELIVSTYSKLENTLIELAKKYKYQMIMGRTHGVHAQIQSLGLKFLNYVAMLKRWLKQFTLIRKDVEVVKLSGAIGNYAFQDPRIEEFVAKKLNLDIAYFSTQVVSRDRHSMYFSCLANLGLIINQLSTEIRHLHRTEVSEVCEGFVKNQKGSSAMPHKKNPITCENICGLSRLLTNLCSVTWENVNLWHERDISHSSNERIVFSDAISLVIYLMRKMVDVLNNINVNLENIEANVKLSGNKNISQALLLFLIKKTNSTREEIYDTIQKYTLSSSNNLLESMKNDPLYGEILKANWEEFSQFTNELQYIDVIYKRIINE